MKEVAECCFLQVYGEIVRSLIERYPIAVKGSFAPGNQSSANESTRSASNATESEPLPKEKMEELSIKLEALGYDVGYRFAERSTRDRPRMSDPLDVIKFLCKDFWILIFKKQIDKLQTNHKGVFVLNDHNFRWFSNFSAENDERTREMELLYLIFPCGVIRGALANLGITAIVNADLLKDVGCLFNIKIKSSR